MEQALIPYQACITIPAQAALVFAPHPDDEIFGCGATLARLAAQGIPVRTIVVTDGACGGNDEQDALVAAREAECRAAAACLGLPTPEFWRLPDRGLRYGEALVERIITAIRAAAADLVFAPSPHEAHPDHSALAMATIEAVRRIGSGIRLALYEIGVPLRPNTLVDISDLLESKRAAMRCFVSQLARQRYDEQIEALNRYRAYTLPPEVVAAEAFELVAAEDVARNLLSVFVSEHRRRSGQGAATVGATDLPLVSIVIRSMDRPSLADALDSIALQTYPHIEVVVVNARGEGHGPLATTCGDYPLRLVGRNAPLPRSRAANVGIEEARGAYLLFLDDDDLLLPPHVAGLVDALRQDGKALAAYGGIRLADHDGTAITAAMNEDYGRAKLMQGNFMPIHAVLFSAELPRRGCRFDETLDHYEDWDFWLQVSRHTEFIHVDSIGGIYRALGESQVGLRADREQIRRQRQAIFDKWRHLWTGQDIEGMLAYKDDRIAELTAQSQERLRILDGELRAKESELRAKESELAGVRATLEAAVADCRGQIDGLRGHCAALEGELAIARREIDATYLSLSWRMTRPLRWLKARLGGGQR
jgi:LmbE family N-acetylglucosaminyl deacetylase/glycosyltransferase involved in cell wall biosynthesis